MTDLDLGWPKEYIAICFMDVLKLWIKNAD